MIVVAVKVEVRAELADAAKRHEIESAFLGNKIER
jgi:hypothetical protein